MQHRQGLLGGPQGVVTHHQGRAADQRGDPAFMGTVEGERHEMQFAIGRVHFVQLGNRLHMHAQRPVGHGDAFRFAGRARGVNQVRQLFRVHIKQWRRHLDVEVQTIHRDHRRARIELRRVAQTLLGQQQAHVAVGHHVAQAFLWILRVQRHVRRAALHHRQQRHHQFQRAFHEHADHVFGLHALLQQVHRKRVGTTVQFGVAQLFGITVGVAQHQCGVLRLQPRPFADQFVYRPFVIVSQCRQMAVQFTALVQCQQTEFADSAAGVVAQPLHQAFHVAAQHFDGGEVELIALMHVLDAQPFIEADHQVHGEAGQAEVGDVFEAQRIAVPLAQRAVHRLIFENDDAVEQRLPALPGPALNIAERGLLEVADVEVVGLNLAQPVTDACFGRHAVDHRQGVDEQPQHVLRTVEGFRAARHRGAERHRALTGVTLQQQQPRGLHQGVERHLLLLGKRLQTRGLLRIQVRVDRVITRLRRLHRQRAGQVSGAFEGVEFAFPERFAGLGHLLAEPVDVVAIRGHRLLRIATVMTQHFTDQARHTPAVHEDVVVGPDQAITVVFQTHQQQAQQRCAIQREATFTFIAGQLTHALGLVIQTAPVQLGQQRRRIAQHHLQRLLVALPQERGAQDRVTLCSVGPGFVETRTIHATHAHFDLVDVQPRIAVLHRMEQHALLHRRQWINVVHLVRRQSQRLILRVAQFDFQRWRSN